MDANGNVKASKNKCDTYGGLGERNCRSTNQHALSKAQNTTKAGSKKDRTTRSQRGNNGWVDIVEQL